jgi:hypothetical protein
MATFVTVLASFGLSKAFLEDLVSHDFLAPDKGFFLAVVRSTRGDGINLEVKFDVEVLDLARSFWANQLTTSRLCDYLTR